MTRWGTTWDKPTVIVTLDAKRRVSIPAALAPASPGDQFDASFDPDDDVVVLRRIKRKTNWLSVWMQCPVPMDDLPSRNRQLPRRGKPILSFNVATASEVPTNFQATTLSRATTPCAAMPAPR